MNFPSAFTEARSGVGNIEGVPALVASAVHDRETGLHMRRRST
jgi:hypothetical protein